MNAGRRKRIAALQERIQDCIDEAELLRDEEQEYFDNMPEAIQAGARGDTAMEDVDALQETYDNLECARDSLGGIS